MLSFPAMEVTEAASRRARATMSKAASAQQLAGDREYAAPQGGAERVSGQFLLQLFFHLQLSAVVQLAGDGV
jgi:hypothetical protein